jgi:hypothetical protein
MARQVAYTMFRMMDIPPVLDTDTDPGFYVAASGVGSGAWGGAALYRALGGASEKVGVITGSARIGGIQNVLGDFSNRGNIFDETNFVQVFIEKGELASVPLESVLSGNGGLMVVGDEVIQYANCRQIGTHLYMLSRLLRGRKGTEWAMASHYIGERVVVYDPDAWIRVPLDTDQLNIENAYKAVSNNQRFVDGRVRFFTWTDVSRKPLSPCQLGGGRESFRGNITLNWVRRARLNAGWNDGSDVALDEDSEAYKVEIVASGSPDVRRSITGLSTTTTSYTTAMQITDFGSAAAVPNPLTFRVYQYSADYGGYGYAATGTIPTA